MDYSILNLDFPCLIRYAYFKITHCHFMLPVTMSVASAEIETYLCFTNSINHEIIHTMFFSFIIASKLFVLGMESQVV